MQTSAHSLIEKAERATPLLGFFSNPSALTGDVNQDLVIGGPLGLVEHMLHELSHAALLGIEPSEHTANDVGATLDALAGVMATSNEAQTFAVEAHVLDHFGLLGDDMETQVDLRSLMDSANVQGVSDDLFMLWYEDSPGIHIVVDQVIEWVTDEGFPESMLEDR